MLKSKFSHGVHIQREGAISQHDTGVGVNYVYAGITL